MEDEVKDRKKAKRRKAGPATKVKKPASSDEEVNNSLDEEVEDRKKVKQRKAGPSSKVKKPVSSDDADDNEENPAESDEEEIPIAESDTSVKGESNADNGASSEEEAPLSKRTSKKSAKSSKTKSDEEPSRGRKSGRERKVIKPILIEESDEEPTRGRRSGRDRKVIKETLIEESYGEDSGKPTEESDFEPTEDSDYEVEETTRRSGRDRKKVEKFVPEVSKVKKKKKKEKLIESSEENEDVGSASDSQEKDDDNESASDAKEESEASEESEYEKPKPKKKKKKAPSIHSHKKSKRPRQRKKVVRNSDESDVSDSDHDQWEKNYKAQQKLQQKGKKNKRNKNGSPSKAHSGATTGRARGTKVSYADDSESQSEDVRSDFDPEEYAAVEVVDQEEIHLILDNRKGKVGATGEATMYHTVKEKGDPNETLETTEMETQYLIKWKGWAHMYNTWETLKTLDKMKKGEDGKVPIKGLKKLANYQNSLREYQVWKRRASPEDIEYQEIDLEMGRNLWLTYLECERIFSKRKGDEQNEYYIKWKNLPYDEATWEEEDMIKKNYPEMLEGYKKRRKLDKDPNDYKDGMKGYNKTFRPMKEQPDFIGNENFRLRDYQVDGVNFLLRAWYKNNSVILADEMGLGKTIQTVAFVKYLWHQFNFNGPMLVCVPLSTITAWQKEFDQWAPEMNCITYIGTAKSREVIREFECQNEDGELSFNVILTNYEMVSKDASFFQGMVWSNIIVDEAHRLKNDQSLLYRILVGMESYHRVLLTGTPLQNSLKELWCLLNYLQVDEIGTWDTFEAAYGTDQDKSNGYVKLHSLLKPYIIRRMKKDVEKSLPGKMEQILRVDMTVRQKKLYKLVLTKNYHDLSKGKNQVSLLNIMMQLRKTCNHAELIQEIDINAKMTSEERLKQIVYGSGKMLLLDKLLTRFKEKGDRVLIFSQMVIMLSILEEFLELKRYSYQILTGSVSNDKRKQSIANFNAEGSTDFCFLLSTRAGGLGINLQTANRVIIFDSDFNPQNDLQAIARAHRIGQKEEVKIFRFVSSSSVDEDIIHRAKSKMVLDHLVIQNMDTTGKAVIGKKTETKLDKDDLNAIIKFGAADLFKNDGDEGTEEQDKEVDLDAILEKAELREEEEAPISEANRELLSAFKVNKITFEETEEEEEKEKEKGWGDIIPKDQRPEEEKPKQYLEGLELCSDTEDLYAPIAKRRKTRTKKVKTPKKNEISDAEEEDKGSDYNKGSSDSEGSSVGSDVEEPEEAAPVSKICFRCLEPECTKIFATKGSLTSHMRQKHPAVAFTFSAENYGNLPTVKSTHNFCIPCGSRFSHITMYQLHIAGQVHKGIEPEDNFDDEKMEALKESNRQRMEEIRLQREKAKQDKMAQMQKNIKNIKDFQLQKGHLQQLQQKSTLQRKICLKCRKVFADNGYLKQHMHHAHGEKDFEPSEGNSYTIQTTQQNSRGVLLSNPRTNPQNPENRLMNKKNYVCIEGDCKKEFVEKKRTQNSYESNS